MENKVADKKRFKRLINSYVLAQDDPTENIELLQKYLKAKRIADVSTDFLKRKISSHIKSKRRDEKLRSMEARLFKKDDQERTFRPGSAICSNCGMYKDYEKECPYCGKLELTR
ncbi:MAG: hypothetical protein ACLFSM_03670 [Thermoplasmata archaeon]